MAAARAKAIGISVEIIDLRTILPWDEETVINSIKKTGKCIVTHEAPITCGFGAELSAKI
jgi:2-oxoisovalerate dehydrogenase E1 component beta subunit